MDRTLTFRIDADEDAIDPKWVGQMLLSVAADYRAYSEFHDLRLGNAYRTDYRLAIQHISISSLNFDLVEKLKVAAEIAGSVFSVAQYGRRLVELFRRRPGQGFAGLDLNVARLDAVRAMVSAAIDAGATLRVTSYDQHGSLVAELTPDAAPGFSRILADPLHVSTAFMTLESDQVWLGAADGVQMTCYLASDGHVYGATAELSSAGFLRVFYPSFRQKLVDDMTSGAGSAFSWRWTARATVLRQRQVPVAYAVIDAADPVALPERSP